MKKREKKSGKEHVIGLAERLVRQLKPHCKRIQVAGSIRRKEKNPVDIDLVLIPKNKEKIREVMERKGKYLQGGDKETTWKIEGVKAELYYSTQDEWGAMLMAYSGKRGSNIGLRIVARTKGLKLTRHGLFNRKTGKRIAGKTEREIYSALGRPYKEPADR